MYVDVTGQLAVQLVVQLVVQLAVIHSFVNAYAFRRSLIFVGTFASAQPEHFLGLFIFGAYSTAHFSNGFPLF
jgi:hypothetical protein